MEAMQSTRYTSPVGHVAVGGNHDEDRKTDA